MGRQLTAVQRAEKLASQQHAAISRRQALEAGLSTRQLKRLVADGRWAGAARNVYLISGAPKTWKQRAAVAWLAGPPGTLLAGRTAAALHGLGQPPAVPEITVPYGRSGRIKGVRVRWARSPAGKEDRRWRDGLPCTDIARTIADLAAELSYDRLCDLVDEAIVERKTRPPAIESSAARAAQGNGRPGSRKLKAVLAIWRPGPLPDSVCEMRLARRVEQWGFPALERQVKIRNAQGKVIAKADLGLSKFKIFFEYDGKKGHSIRYWAKDDARDKTIEDLGGTILRFNRHDLLPSSTRLRDEIQAIIDAFPQLTLPGVSDDPR